MNDFSEEILLLRQRLDEAEKYLKIDELKDQKLSQEAAKTNGAFTPLASLATDLYESFATNDKNEDLDFSSIIKLIENQ